MIALLAAFVGVGLAPAISRRFGKKRAMIGVFFASLFASTTPITLRLFGLLPPNRTTALLAIVMIFYFLATTLGLSGFIIVTSMMADVVEDAAVTTGHRSEGLLFAANGLVQKCVTGVGTFLSGLILTWVSFPQHAIQGQVDPAILHHLGMVFVPIVAVFSAVPDDVWADGVPPALLEPDDDELLQAAVTSTAVVSRAATSFAESGARGLSLRSWRA